MSAEVLTNLNLEEVNNRLLPKCSGSETLWTAGLLEAGSLCISHQWDLGGEDSVFNYYCTRRVFGDFTYGTQEAFKLLGFVLQWHFAIVLVIAFPVIVTAAILLKMFMSDFFGDLQTVHAISIITWKDKRQFPYLSLGDKAVF
ncbi:transmembrane protein [Spatholobus suberectus]|nr:transmembrane protein [Spatholobus suberectus]